MAKRIIYTIFLILAYLLSCAQNLPAGYDLSSSEKLELLYLRTIKIDSIELAKEKILSESAYLSASYNKKIKALARNLKFAANLKNSNNSQLSDLNYINAKLAKYESDYGVKVLVKFSNESFKHFKTDLTKLLLTLMKDGVSTENCIVAEVSGNYNGSSFENEIGYKLYTLGEYASLNSLSNYTKLIQNPQQTFQRAVFEDLDQLFFENQNQLAEVSSLNSALIGGDLLMQSMQNAGTGACAFCKTCAQNNNSQNGSGTTSVGDGFSSPIKIIKNNVTYNCVIANYNSTNSVIVTSTPSNLNLSSFGNNKITPKGDQFVILKKTALNEDEFITCIATQQYNDYCSSSDPFSNQQFKDKIALEIQSCAQQEETQKQLLLSKYSNMAVKGLTYVYESGYLVTKTLNSNTSIKQFSQAEYNKLVQDLKAGKLSSDQALVLKKTNTGYDVKANYGSNVIVKPGYEMGGMAIDKSEIAFETVMNEFLQHKNDLGAIEIRSSGLTFEDSKKIDVKESTVWGKIQDGLSAGREFIEEAKITEKYYNSNSQGYNDNWVNTPPLLSGVGNGIIEEVKEIPQLVFLACDIATKEEVRTGIWNGLKGLTLEKVKNGASGLLNNWTDTYEEGGDVAWHQGGKDGVMVFTILSPAGLLKNADDVLSKNVDEVAEKVRRKGSRLSRKEINDLALTATQNKNANKVMLGKYEVNSSSSYETLAGSDYTFYMLENWQEIYEKVGSDYDEMWKINQKFMDDQIFINKPFYFSHDPFSPTNGSGYAREINYLIEKGVKSFIKEGNLWKAIW